MKSLTIGRDGDGLTDGGEGATTTENEYELDEPGSTDDGRDGGGACACVSVSTAFNWVGSKETTSLGTAEQANAVCTVDFTGTTSGGKCRSVWCFFEQFLQLPLLQFFAKCVPFRQLMHNPCFLTNSKRCLLSMSLLQFFAFKERVGLLAKGTFTSYFGCEICRN